jgi:hypothetical protein
MKCKDLNINPRCEVCTSRNGVRPLWSCWVSFFEKEFSEYSIVEMARMISKSRKGEPNFYFKKLLESVYPEYIKKIETFNLLK